MWALAVTRPRAERIVSKRLQDRSFEHCIFHQRITEIRQGRKIEKITPAFPRYVFVRVADEAVWRFVLELRDHNGMDLVQDFVRGAENQPAIIHHHVVDQLRATAKDDILPQLPSQERFKFGDKVRISAGRSVMTGSEGLYQWATAPGKSCILLPWLGRMVPVEVEDNEIEPVFKPTRERRRRRRGGQRRSQQYRRRHTEDAKTARPMTAP